MKYRPHVRDKQLERHVPRAMPVTVRDHDDELAPPDPSTRVDVEFASDASIGVTAHRRGELIVAAGLGGILVSVCSAFVKLLDLPSLSEKSLAGLGGVLVLIGALKRYSVRSAVAVAAGESIEPIEARLVAIDLPTLTGQISGVLAQLRHDHGMAYRTRTWIEEILPKYGLPLADPMLARDLLAVAALDAGGIRADVVGLAEAHSCDSIVATGSAVLEALQHALEASQDSDKASPRSSDPSGWPASTC